MSAIGNDAAHEEFNPADLGPDSGFDEFLKSFLPPDAEKPSEGTPEKKEDETPEETTEETEDDSDESPEKSEDDEESSEGDEEEKKPARKYADDGVYVKVKVDGTEHEVAVKDLQRLFGQEASLTQKSQQVAEERKRVETELAKNTATTTALLDRAKARFEPYSKIDFLLAAQKLSAEEYTALRQEAVKAYEDVQFLEQHRDAFMNEINTRQQTTQRETAQATLKELASDDPEKGIPGWSEKTYDELRVYGMTKLGVPKDVMNNVVDAWALRVLHKAMLYDRGTKNKVTVTKVNKTPKKVIKTSTTPEANQDRKGSDTSSALKRQRETGSIEDTEAAFLASFADRD